MRGPVAAMLLIAALQACATDAGGPPRIVGAIGFTGNALIGTAELIRITGIHIGEPLEQATIDGALRRIAAAYRAGGNEVAVEAAFTPSRDAKTRVEFIIVEQQPHARGAVPSPGRARSGGVPPPPPPEERR